MFLRKKANTKALEQTILANLNELRGSLDYKIELKCEKYIGKLKEINWNKAYAYWREYLDIKIENRKKYGLKSG